MRNFQRRPVIFPRLYNPLSDLPEQRNPGINKEEITEEPFIIGELADLSAAFAALMMNPRLWDIAATILENDNVIYHFSNITRKPAFKGPSVNWHRDFPNRYLCPEDSDNFLRLLLPLEGMNQSSGCTTIVTKSHAISDEEAIREHQQQSRDMSQHKHITALELKQGQAAAIHPKLLHGGPINRSQLSRNLLVIQFGIPANQWMYHEEQCRLTGLNRHEVQEVLNINACNSL